MMTGVQVQYNGDSINQVRSYKTAWFYNGSGATIPAGAVCVWDAAVDPPGGGAAGNGSGAIKASTGAEDTLVIGGALRPIPNGAWGEVVYQGIQTDALLTGALTAGQLLESISAGARLEAMTAPAATKLNPVARSVGVVGAGAQVGPVEWLNPSQL